MPDGHNEEIGALKTSVDFLREGQERVERRMEEGFCYSCGWDDTYEWPS